MIYQLIKTVHIVSVISFVGGLLVLAVLIKASNLAVLRTVRRWDRMLTLPALGLVWATGLTIAMQGQWFGNGWLAIKLIAVLGLSGLHGALSGALRRIEAGNAASVPEVLRHAGIATISAVSAISFLVMLKPAMPDFRITATQRTMQESFEVDAKKHRRNPAPKNEKG